MPATLPQIYAVRQALENGPTPGSPGGLAGLFTEAGYNVVTRQNQPADFQQLRPRVEIKVEIGPATGRLHLFSTNERAFDAWAFNVAIQCVTAPGSDPATNTSNELFVAEIRALMQQAAQITWADTTNFPYHLIAEPFRDAGTADTLKTSEGVEYSTLSFAGIVCVRGTAWPSTPTP